MNRIPTSILEKITPYDAWYEKKPNLNQFKVFGCLSYTHVVDEIRKNLYTKSEVCIFWLL